MSDEVIDGPAQYGGGARALPLFSLSGMSCTSMTSSLVASSFETARSLSSGRASRGPVGASSG
jgi:hypothetical protein